MRKKTLRGQTPSRRLATHQPYAAAGLSFVMLKAVGSVDELAVFTSHGPSLSMPAFPSTLPPRSSPLGYRSSLAPPEEYGVAGFFLAVSGGLFVSERFAPTSSFGQSLFERRVKPVSGDWLMCAALASVCIVWLARCDGA